MSASVANADEYLGLLSGWQRELVGRLRKVVRAAAKFDEAVKWGHLVYYSNGPVLLIRAEEKRVLFGFWRGKRLREIEPALKASGRYEMATLELREGMSIADATARRLAREAVALNKSLGDPTDIAKSNRSTRSTRATANGSRGLPSPARHRR
jgi:hypothetical protein